MTNPRRLGASLIVIVSLGVSVAATPALAQGPNCPNPNQQPRTTIEEQSDLQDLRSVLRDRAIRSRIDVLRAAEERRAIGDLPDPAIQRAAADSAALDDAMGLVGF